MPKMTLVVVQRFDHRRLISIFTFSGILEVNASIAQRLESQTGVISGCNP